MSINWILRQKMGYNYNKSMPFDNIEIQINQLSNITLTEEVC